MPRKSPFEHACHRCGTAIRADEPPDGTNSFCPTCLDQNLREVERWFLEDYVYFGAKARSTSAAVYLTLFKSTDDVRVRKFAGLSIYEQFMLATEDLAMLYFALRDRDRRSVLDTFLGFEINPATSNQWQDELQANDDEVLERLGSVKEGGPGGWIETMQDCQA